MNRRSYKGKNNPNWKGGKIKTTCTCGKEFSISGKQLARGRGKYCSRKCKGMGWNSKLEHNTRWNGGKTMVSGGLYKAVKLTGHPRASKAGYVREHHLVMERFLGRYLNPDEEVHHKNGIKTDNRIDNLQLVSNRSDHLRMEHKLGTYRDHLYKLNGEQNVEVC